MTTDVAEPAWRREFDRISRQHRAAVRSATARFEHLTREIVVAHRRRLCTPPDATAPDWDAPTTYLLPANLDVRTRPENPTEEPDEPTPTSWLVR